MSQNKRLLALDIGTVRTGVAMCDGVVSIAVPLPAVTMDDSFVEQVQALVQSTKAAEIIIGYPRNQSGEPTKQTEYVKKQAQLLKDAGLHVVFQDESLSSVLAEERLQKQGKPYTKADIDSYAAAIILEDYLEIHS